MGKINKVSLILVSFATFLGMLFLPIALSDNHIIIGFELFPSLMSTALNNSPVFGGIIPCTSTSACAGPGNYESLISISSTFINNSSTVNASNIASQCQTINLADSRVLGNCNNGDISVNLTNGTINYGLSYAIRNFSTDRYNIYVIATITFNITEKPIFYGKSYNVTVSVLDINGNRTTKIYDLKLLRDALFLRDANIILDANFNTSFNFKNESKIEFTSVKFNSNLTNESIFTFAMYDTPVFNVTKQSVFGRYYNLAITPTAKASLQWAVLRLYYNDSELGILNENLLRLIRTNDNGTQEICISPYGGVDTTNNFVFCNTTKFSEWGIVQVAEPTPTPPSSGGGGSSGGSSNTYYYVPVSVENKTINKTYILPIEKLDCNNSNLPEGSVCNESGVYIPQLAPEIKLETKYEAVVQTVETIPGSIYIGIAVLSPFALVGFLIVVNKIIEFYKGEKK